MKDEEIPQSVQFLPEMLLTGMKPESRMMFEANIWHVAFLLYE